MNFWLASTALAILTSMVAGGQYHHPRKNPRGPLLPFDEHRRRSPSTAILDGQGRHKRSAEWRKKTLDPEKLLDGASSSQPPSMSPPIRPWGRSQASKPKLVEASNLDRRNQQKVDYPQIPDIPYRLPWPKSGHRIDTVRSTTDPPSTSPPIVLYKRECDPCMPGWGVKSMCTESTNTVCKPCQFGEWSPSQPHYRECTPCSQCSRGEFEDSTCVSTRDTRCDRCANPKARINDDFLKRCDLTELAKNMNPQEFDVEVVDMQSKELEGSVEWLRGDAESDPLLVLVPDHLEEPHEMDIHVDDPEIDLERPLKAAPASKSSWQGVEEDVSAEEEAEWHRFAAMRNRARQEVAKLSKRLEHEQKPDAWENDEDDEDDEDEDDFAEQGPRRLLLHPIRPLPQMVPVPRMANADVQPDDDMVQSRDPSENNFPPSYHSYPIDSLLHAGEGQRRKAIVLLALTCAIVLSTIIFVVCYVREYCRRRGAYNRVLVVNLSPEEQEIVRQSATALERMEQSPTKKYRSHGPYTNLDDEDPEIGAYATENPLEAYLNSTDERSVAKESLVENEVENEPRVHSRTIHA